MLGIEKIGCIDDKFVEDNLGHYVLDRCPLCGHRLLRNARGDEWCGAFECTWADDPKLAHFLELCFGDL